MEKQHSIQELLDFLPSIVILTDGSEIKEANRAFFRFTGYDSMAAFKAEHRCICERFIARSGFLSPERGRWRDELMHNQSKNLDSFALMKDPEGQERTFLVRAGVFESGLIAVLFEDVTQLRQAQGRLQEANRSLELQVQERTWELIEANETLERQKTHLEAAQQIAKLGHWSYRMADRVVECAPELLKIFGLRAGRSLRPLSFLRPIFRRDRRRVFQMMRDLQSGGEASLEVRVLASNTQKTVRIYARSYLDDRNRPFYYLGACQDISELTALQEHAYRDPLTRAYNRRKLIELLEPGLEQAAKSAHAVGLVLLDVDHFKRVNDTLGHDVGDSVLIELADRIRGAIGSDAIFCRWGGEEFVVVLPRADQARTLQLAERIHHIVRTHPFKEAGQITCSLGVITYRPGETLHEGIKRCDDALYSAKRSGRDRVVVG